MIRHISPDYFFDLPSGNRVHPNRLILKDGTLMWKHALVHQNKTLLPETQAHEAHIVKTAQRLEELNTWVSHGLEPWDFLKPTLWYSNTKPELNEGICVYFQHTSLPSNDVFDILKKHLNDCESLVQEDTLLLFCRC